LTAIALETTTRAYANDPAPMVVLTPTEPGGGLSTEGAEEIDSVSGLTGAEEAAESLMRAYRSAARVGGAVYLEGVSVTPVGWDPKQLQLVEARQNVVLELARLTGIDADRLGVPVTSRTYANAEQDRQDLIDFSQSVLYQAFTERLSMDDVTPRGTRVRFNLDAFLRGDTLSRMQAYALGKPVGAYTTAEIRELENRPPLTPEQEAAIGAAPSAPVPDPNAQ
jgi:phage portal protein BeeE